MNKKELKAIAKAIVKDSIRFDMDRWVNSNDAYAPCGTVGCIAGWAIMREQMKGKKDLESWKKAGKLLSKEVNYTSHFYAGDKAAEILKLTPSQAESLFHVSSWPQKFITKYYNVEYGNYPKPERRRKQAEITAERIEHFIKTGE